MPRTPCRGGPGTPARAQRVGIAPLRVPRALAQPAAPRGPIPRSMSPQPSQRRTHRCGPPGGPPPSTPCPAQAPAAPQPCRRARAQLVELRRRRGADTVRGTNRFPRALKNAFPQVLPWLPENDTGALGRRPQPLATPPRRATCTPLAPGRGLPGPPGRAADVIAPRLQAIKSASALPPDDGVLIPP